MFTAPGREKDSVSNRKTIFKRLSPYPRYHPASPFRDRKALSSPLTGAFRLHLLRFFPKIRSTKQLRSGFQYAQINGALSHVAASLMTQV
jgi:hypothetical protein